MNQISNWGEAALTSVAAALALFLAAIPRVIGFLIILLVGWFIANLIAKLVANLLRRVNFNGLAERSGISGFVAGMGIQTDAAGCSPMLRQASCAGPQHRRGSAMLACWPRSPRGPCGFSPSWWR